MYLRAAVNLPSVFGEYDYAIPPHLAGQIGVGSLVTLPFGAQTAQGVALDLLPAPSVAQPKAILDLLDPNPVLTPAQVWLARHLAQETLQPVAAFIALMLPTGISKQADTLYTLRGSPALAGISPTQARILALLQERGPLRGRQLESHFARVDWRKSAQALVRQGILNTRSVLPPPSVRPKYIRMAQLAVTPQQAQESLPTLGRTPATLERRQRALRFLMQEPQAVAVSWVYAQAGCNLADLQELAERELILLFETEIFRGLPASSPEDPSSPSLPLLLTPAQQTAWDALSAALPAPSLPFLLRGVTGSGKTELYLRAVDQTLRQGKGALVLVPEIALTPQTVRRFLARFPGQVGVLHSRLSEGERYDTWRRARSGQVQVIIGARSALFAPLPQLGLIVLDECHDPSYYQSEPPFYHAAEAALAYARHTGALALFGSATPPVDLRFYAQQGAMRLLELTERVIEPAPQASPSLRAALPGGLAPVSVVDMRLELQSGNRGIFSRTLLESLAETLERGEQAILYLNRRGTATYVFCRACGYVAECPQCQTPLVQHGEAKNAVLRCHRCGYQRKLPAACPQCASPHIRAYGLGSEKVEQEVQAHFPQARTLRWDSETTTQKDAHEHILTHFSNHQADVLVGTQMLAKGLHLPLVTLVGVVLAEVGLTLPDPFAGERVFQLLTQVAGRAGRSARGGRVILQTFMPQNPVIVAAAGQDYTAFYQQELQNRLSLGYPPYYRLARLEYRHEDEAQAQTQAESLAAAIRLRLLQTNQKIEVIGAFPSPFAKLGENYRWQILLRGADPANFLRQVAMPPGWRVETSPRSLL